VRFVSAYAKSPTLKAMLAPMQAKAKITTEIRAPQFPRLFGVRQRGVGPRALWPRAPTSASGDSRSHVCQIFSPRADKAFDAAGLNEISPRSDAMPGRN
jgi:hypothetical protein